MIWSVHRLCQLQLERVCAIGIKRVTSNIDSVHPFVLLRCLLSEDLVGLPPRMSWEVSILTEDPCEHYFHAISTFPLHPVFTSVLTHCSGVLSNHSLLTKNQCIQSRFSLLCEKTKQIGLERWLVR